MQEYLEKLLYFWAAITGIGLVLVIVYWAIATIIYVAFISLFIAIVAAAFYQFYWVKKKTCLGLFERCDSIEDIQRVIKS